MVGCAAFNCFNNSSNKTNEDQDKGKKKATFHKFPKDPGLCKKWVENLRLENFLLNENKRICNEHFLPECYKRNPELMKSLGIKDDRMILKEGAIPTEFDRGSPKGRKQMKGKIRFKATDSQDIFIEPQPSEKPIVVPRLLRT